MQNTLRVHLSILNPFKVISRKLCNIMAEEESDSEPGIYYLLFCYYLRVSNKSQLLNNGGYYQRKLSAGVNCSSQ